MIFFFAYYDISQTFDKTIFVVVSPVSLVATLSTISIPSCYKQAMEHECWQIAMQAELQALEENYTWDIVPCPPTVKPIGSK